MRGQYKNAHGIYTADARDSESTGTQPAAWARQEAVLLDGGIYHGRPITDSFAVDGLDDVTVENGSILMGKAGNDSTLLVPDLSSYNQKVHRNPEPAAEL